MGPFEYLLMFVAVILGLAVSDLAMSLHRLLGAGSRVRWDWLTPFAALVALLKVITQWWSWFDASQIAKGLTFEMFVGIVIAAILLFLMTASALPDDVNEPVVDLRGYYAANAKRYWLLFAAHWLVANLVVVWVQIKIIGANNISPSPYYLIVPVALSLAFWRNRWWHTICLAGFSGLYLTQLIGAKLT